MIKKLWLFVVASFLLTASQGCKAGNLYEDLKYFIKNNEYYKHALVVGASILSFDCFNHYLQKNQNAFSSKANPYLAFGGACIVASLVKDNPGSATLLGLGYIIYSLMK